MVAFASPATARFAWSRYGRSNWVEKACCGPSINSESTSDGDRRSIQRRSAADIACERWGRYEVTNALIAPRRNEHGYGSRCRHDVEVPSPLPPPQHPGGRLRARFVSRRAVRRRRLARVGSLSLPAPPGLSECGRALRLLEV